MAKKYPCGTVVLLGVATRTNALWQRSTLTLVVEGAAVATRTNALWQSLLVFGIFLSLLVATRANALWQSRFGNMSRRKLPSRNPHECAVAKIYREGRFERLPRRNPHECAVAKLLANKLARYAQVATRANALWQRTGESAGSCTLRRRNPRECAVAKWIILFFLFAGGGRNPRECAVAKFPRLLAVKGSMESQPARMR